MTIEGRFIYWQRAVPIADLSAEALAKADDRWPLNDDRNLLIVVRFPLADGQI
jgi:hypothetical protein